MRAGVFLFSVMSVCLVTQNAMASPTVSGNTISWPSSGWYQVQRPTAQNGEAPNWNLCNSNRDGTSCTVPNGVYRVNRQGGDPWKVQQTWNSVSVPASTDTSGKPVVTGNKISWPSSGWYQVQRPTAQNGHGVDWNVCSSSGNRTSCTVPNGVYRVIKQGGDPWRVLQKWNNIVVGGDAEYKVTFFEDFKGNKLSSKFAIPGWNVDNRDAVHNKPGACSQSGSNLNLSIKQVGNQRRACYLISKRKNFGPGNDSTLKVEYRANGSQVKARGAWFAGWLFALGKNSSGVDNATDGNAATGMEIDVFEYMPTWGTAYNTAIHDAPFHEEKWIDPSGEMDLTKNKFHTYSIEWNKDCIAYFLDRRRVRTSTRHISKTKNHSIFLTMEAQTGTQWGLWPVGSFANNLAKKPALGKIDWVRVSTKKSIDAGLCTN